MKLFQLFCPSLFLVLLLTGTNALADSIGPQRQSSYQLMTIENQAMQDDPSLNPASFWVMDGHTLWREKMGTKQMACASCHGEDGKKMTGVAVSFPKVIHGRLQTIESQINQCRTLRQGAKAWPYESRELLALTTFVATQSKGLPIAIQETSQNKRDLEKGRHYFNERMGQLNLSCAQCHQDRSGLRLGGVLIPEGHPTAYPIYRIEWQTMGSLQRRLRNCMSGVRAKQFEYGSPEMAQLELYLMWRARGLPLETPGVRP